MDALCTCGHRADQHNALAVCFAPVRLGPDASAAVGLCRCADFTSDDTAIAAAVGVLVDTPGAA